MTTWGDAIAVNDKRPEWLRDDARLRWDVPGLGWKEPERWREWDAREWRSVSAIKLPADHWVYTVLRYNEQHGTNFTPWGGGERVPDDWDGGTVLQAKGKTECVKTLLDEQWRRGTDTNGGETMGIDIVGYTRRAAQPAHMTEREAREHGADDVLVEAKRAAGILREPTLSERFKNERGDWALLDRSELIDCVLTWSAAQ